MYLLYHIFLSLKYIVPRIKQAFWKDLGIKGGSEELWGGEGPWISLFLSSPQFGCLEYIFTFPFLVWLF